MLTKFEGIGLNSGWDFMTSADKYERDRFDDRFKSIEQIITENNFTFQEHQVTTSDGYTLLQQPGVTNVALEGDETKQLQCKDIRLALAWTDLDAFHKDLARRIIGPSMSSL